MSIFKLLNLSPSVPRLIGWKLGEPLGGNGQGLRSGKDAPMSRLSLNSPCSYICGIATDSATTMRYIRSSQQR